LDSKVTYFGNLKVKDNKLGFYSDDSLLNTLADFSPLLKLKFWTCVNIEFRFPFSPLIHPAISCSSGIYLEAVGYLLQLERGAWVC
jgi:hypothetical protein